METDDIQSEILSVTNLQSNSKSSCNKNECYYDDKSKTSYNSYSSNLSSYLNDEKISKGAEVFRNKLIMHFDMLNEPHNKQLPSINAKDVFYKKIDLNKILLTNPYEPICFVSYQTRKHGKMSEPRNSEENFQEYASIKLKKSIFIKLRKSFNLLIKSKYYEYLILFFLIFDSILIGVKVDIIATRSNDLKLCADHTYLILAILQIITTSIFMLEIILNLIVDFNGYWKSKFNIMDIFITVMTTLMDIFELSTDIRIQQHKTDSNLYQLIRYLSNLRVLRLLKILKIVKYFTELRIIVTALTKAVKSVFLIFLLLFTIAYVFANIGEYLFIHLKYSNDDPYFNGCFSSVGETLLTLFALMTLDQWWRIYTRAAESNDDSFFSTLFFMVWIIVAAFVIQNLFTGVMVSNFKLIRKEVEQQILKAKRIENRLEDNASDDQLNETKLSQANSSSASKLSSTHISSLNDVDDSARKLEQILSTFKSIRIKNTRFIEKNENRNLKSLFSNLQSSWWHEDTLIDYYEIMQNLMDNLEERMMLLDMANKHLLSMHDRDNILQPKKYYQKSIKKYQ